MEQITNYDGQRIFLVWPAMVPALAEMQEGIKVIIKYKIYFQNP